MSRQNISFFKIFESYFSEMKSSKNWSMAISIWLFLHKFQGPVTRVCITQIKHLILLNDNTQQDFLTEIQSDKIRYQT